MAIENVGLGKLPNVYFEKITLEEHDEKSFAVVSHLIVLDELSQTNFIWSSDPLISGFMKIALIETSNQEMSDELTRGENLHPTSIKSSPNWDSDSRLHMYGYGDLFKSEDVDDRHFKLKTLITKPKDASRLTLFAYAYIDHKELSNYLEIKLTGPLSNYMGPVSSEIVMEDGVIPKSSNIFRQSDSTVWSGPVHQVGDEWYSGSQPSDDSIDLRRETVKNSKIIDFRFKVLRDRSSMSFSNMPMISDAHYSFNSNADLFGVFSVDMKNVVLSQTKFGKAIYGLDEDLFLQVVNSLDLNSAEIYRRQVRFTRQTNYLGSPKYSKQDVLPREIVATMANLKKLDIANNKFIKSYSFSDHGKNERDRGEFVYEAKMTFVDKTQDLIETFINNIRRNINGLKDVVRRLNSPNNYDYETDSLRLNEGAPQIIKSYISDYYKFIGMIKDIEQEDLNEMIKTKESSFNSSNYKTNYGLKFIDEYQKLYNLMHRRFGVFPRELRQAKSAPSHSYPPNIIEISKTFEDLVKFNDVESSYDVLGTTDNKEILVLSREDMEARADMEVSRFFDTSKSVSSEDTFGIDDNDSEALRDLGASKMSFLAPLGFRFQGQEVSTKQISNVDLDKISMNFVESKKKKTNLKFSSRSKASVDRKAKKVKQRTKRKQKSKTNRFKFNFRPVVMKINQITKKKNDHIDSSDYLGDNSEFVNIEVNTDTSIDPKDTTQANLRFLIANEISTKRSKKNFDLKEKGSFYEKFKSSNNYDVEKLRKLPLSTKSLFNSRSRAAQNNILEAESDILKEVDTKVATEMIFHTNQKIEVLDGYEKNSNGESIMTKPLWVELTPELLDERKEVLCKMSYVEDASIGVVPAKEFKMPVLNSTFIVTGTGTTENTVPEILEELPEVGEIAYTTSNIVKQPRS